MRVLIVCTGNIIRSPALACLLMQRRPDLRVESAAVGKKAAGGLRMKPQMRKILHQHGYGQFADGHRSRLLVHVAEKPDLIVGVAPAHMERLAELAPHVPAIMTQPRINDPVRGGEGEYRRAWDRIVQAVAWLDDQIPDGSCE